MFLKNTFPGVLALVCLEEPLPLLQTPQLLFLLRSEVNLKTCQTAKKRSKVDLKMIWKNPNRYTSRRNTFFSVYFAMKQLREKNCSYAGLEIGSPDDKPNMRLSSGRQSTMQQKFYHPGHMCLLARTQKSWSHFWPKVMTTNGVYHFSPSAKSRRELKSKHWGSFFEAHLPIASNKP